MNSVYSANRFPQRNDNVVNDEQGGESYLDVIGMIKRKLFLISICSLLGICAGLIFYFNSTKIYESSASLFVDDASLSVGTSRSNPSQAEASIEKFIEVLRSDRIVGPAIEACDPSQLKSLASLEPEDDVTEFIKDNLYVRSSDKKAESGVITISLSSTEEEEAKQILISVINVFSDFISDSTEKVGGKNVQTIAQMQAENAAELEQKQSEIDTLMLKPHIHASEGKVLNPYQQHMVKIQEELHEKQSELVELEALREQIEDAHLKGLPIQDIVIEALDQVSSSPLRHYAETQQELIRLRMLESELFGDYGAAHPDLRNTREQIKLLKNMRQRQLLSLFGSNPPDEISKLDFYSHAITHLSRKIELLKSHHDKLDAAMSDAKHKSTAIKKDCDRLAFLLSQREALSERSMQMMDHSIELGVLRDTKNRDVELINYPTTAQKVFPKLKLCLPIGAILGCGVGLCWGLFRETRERTFHSSKEISAFLGLPVVAEIGKFDTRRLRSEEFKDVGGSVVALHRPLSVPGEVFKSLRTEIIFDAPDKSAKVIQITSPLPGDGKSSVAANLAVTLAQAGRRVILVDCDLRRPALGKLFSLDDEMPGLTSVLLEEAELDDAIQSIGVENLGVLCSGVRYSNPADILTSESLPNLLDTLSQKFDYVILDTPPLLPVTDASIISNFVDTIFLTLRIREGTQSTAERAILKLDSVREKIQGIIVNGVTRSQGGGFLESDSCVSSASKRRYGLANAYGESRGLTPATIKTSPPEKLKKPRSPLQIPKPKSKPKSKSKTR